MLSFFLGPQKELFCSFMHPLKIKITCSNDCFSVNDTFSNRLLTSAQVVVFLCLWDRFEIASVTRN